MSGSIVFELCAENLQACLAAGQGGAARIELCSALIEDGLTPSHALIDAAVKCSGIPVHVLLRPRGGDFVYNDDEFRLMRDDLLHARSLGVSGFAVGILRTDSTVDIERTQELVELAAPLEVTFHRAFDLTPSLEQSLEDVIATGCNRILTSGGERDVVVGAGTLAMLVSRAADRVSIAAGGGLTIENAAFVASNSKAKHFHGSLRRMRPGLQRNERHGILASSEQPHIVVDPADIRAILRQLGDAPHQ
ncbi:copper homeostasis protein CutC [Edaphobacter sp. HDX4]|uniref:copper homeostasis protein CutC n=1 Tax=Edaphobacter sp. HDX4 TaxID=2794064 RepID=UPI002FE58B50